MSDPKYSKTLEYVHSNKNISSYFYMILPGRYALFLKESIATVVLFGIKSIRKENKGIYLNCFQLFDHLQKKMENCCH